MGHYWDITRLLSAFRESFQPCPCRTVATPVIRQQIDKHRRIAFCVKKSWKAVIHKSGKNRWKWVESTAIVWSVCMVWSMMFRLELSSALRLLGTGTSIRYHIDMDITREAFTPRWILGAHTTHVQCYNMSAWCWKCGIITFTSHS